MFKNKVNTFYLHFFFAFLFSHLALAQVNSTLNCFSFANDVVIFSRFILHHINYGEVYFHPFKACSIFKDPWMGSIQWQRNFFVSV